MLLQQPLHTRHSSSGSIGPAHEKYIHHWHSNAREGWCNTRRQKQGETTRAGTPHPRLLVCFDCYVLIVLITDYKYNFCRRDCQRLDKEEGNLLVLLNSFAAARKLTPRHHINFDTTRRDPPCRTKLAKPVRWVFIPAERHATRPLQPQPQ